MKRLTSEEQGNIKAQFSFIIANGVGWGPKNPLLNEEWLEANVAAGWLRHRLQYRDGKE